MKLVKRNENVNRIFSGEATSEEITNVGYSIQNDEGAEIGSCNVREGGFDLNVHSMGGTIDEIKTQVESMFNKLSNH